MILTYTKEKWPKSKSPEPYDNFQRVAKDIEGFFFFSYLHIYYVAKFG